MFVCPDTPCKKCNYIYFDVSENGLIYTCINCSTDIEYFNGSELTAKVLKGLQENKEEDEDGN